MKISKLQKFAWAFFALALTTTTLFAQDSRSVSGVYVQNIQDFSCVNVLPDLTENQISAITDLELKHRQNIDALRDKRRSTTNLDEKDLIREEMLENVEIHRAAVSKLLTEEQQKEYDLLLNQGNNFRNQRFANQRGNRNFQGRGQGNLRSKRGDGYGAGYQSRSQRGRGFRGQGRYYRN